MKTIFIYNRTHSSPITLISRILKGNEVILRSPILQYVENCPKLQQLLQRVRPALNNADPISVNTIIVTQIIILQDKWKIKVLPLECHPCNEAAAAITFLIF